MGREKLERSAATGAPASLPTGGGATRNATLNEPGKRPASEESRLSDRSYAFPRLVCALLASAMVACSEPEPTAPVHRVVYSQGNIRLVVTTPEVARNGAALVAIAKSHLVESANNILIVQIWDTERDAPKSVDLMTEEQLAARKATVFLTATTSRVDRPDPVGDASRTVADTVQAGLVTARSCTQASAEVDASDLAGAVNAFTQLIARCLQPQLPTFVVW